MAIPYTFAGQSGVIPLAELDSNFAYVGDSSGVTYVPAGTSAVATTVQAALRQVVNVTDFGADPTGAVNCNTAFANAVTYAKTLTAPELIINPGTYTANNVLNFDLPNYSKITFLGSITSSVANNPAIRIGSVSTNTFGLIVTGIKVQRSSIDTTGGSTGVQLRNLSASYIDIRKVLYFRDGINCYGDQPNGGFSYNEVHMGFIHDNLRNLYLACASPGYCNENNFYGGTFNHSSTYPSVNTINYELQNFAPSPLNDNRLYGPSFEDSYPTNWTTATSYTVGVKVLQSTLAYQCLVANTSGVFATDLAAGKWVLMGAPNIIAATIYGNNNVIYWPRMEVSVEGAPYQIIFANPSSECRVIGNSFGLTSSANILDNGTGNMYETRQGTVLRYQTPATAGNAVLKLQGYFTSSAKALSVLDSTGAEQAYITGNGVARFTGATVVSSSVPLVAQNTSTSTATVLSVLDSGGVETAKITGVGEAKFTGTTRALAIYNTSGFETAYVTGAGDAYFNSITGPVSINLTGPVTSVGAATTIVGPIPAVSLSGTISGAGNQINNVVIGTTTPLAGSFTSLSASTLNLTNALGVAYGGTNATTASITSFNNITGYTAAGATGTTSTNLVFSESPSLTGTVAIPTKLLVGGPTSATFAGGVQIYGDATTFAPSTLVRGYSNTTSGPSLIFVKTRGTTASSTTAVQSGDTLGSIGFYGADGTSNQAFGAITGVVDGAVSAGVVPTAITFTTGTSSGTQQMVITSSGRVGIGTGTPDASAKLEVNSTTQGVKFPNMTTTQKNAISAPGAGLVIFDTTLAKLCVYSGSAWQTITSV